MPKDRVAPASHESPVGRLAELRTILTPSTSMRLSLSRSFRRKLAVTCVASVAFTLLYEATVYDSRSAARQAELREERLQPAPGLRLKFTATAYCKGTTTASGTAVRTGIAAADPDLLPVGSVIQLDSLGPRYNGIYTVMDTGPRVQGRHIDVYMWSCHEALAFGRRNVHMTVLRLGWNPRATSPNLLRALFGRRERARTSQPPPSAPPAASPPPATSPGVPAPAGGPSTAATPARPDGSAAPAATDPTPAQTSAPAQSHGASPRTSSGGAPAPPPSPKRDTPR